MKSFLAFFAFTLISGFASASPIKSILDANLGQAYGKFADDKLNCFVKIETNLNYDPQDRWSPLYWVNYSESFGHTVGFPIYSNYQGLTWDSSQGVLSYDFVRQGMNERVSFVVDQTDLKVLKFSNYSTCIISK